MIVFNGYVYAVGGISDSDLITAERFDPKIEKWTMIHSLKTAKSWMGAAKLMGKFVIIG